MKRKETELRCGLLGKTLGHSRSPEIHAKLGSYSYRLIELPEEQVAEFLRKGEWDGLNVTIPYKKTVIPFLDGMSEVVRHIGSANTLVRREDGAILGDNTDVYGFEQMVRRGGFNLKGRKTLVLGSGGASAAVREALRRMEAAPVITVSRSGPDNYRNLDRHRDAEFLVNTTPVGMYPEEDASPLDLRELPGLRGVLDLIYRPAETKLLRQARTLGIPGANGLYMLAAQAWKSAELFTGKHIPEERVEQIYEEMMKS